VDQVTDATAASVERFYSEHLHPVELRSLHLNESDLEQLDRKFADFGLHRKRAIFMATHGEVIVGAVVCNYASEGMNFSFLENALEYLAIATGLPADLQTEVVAALLRAAMEYYTRRGRAYMVALTEPIYAPILEHLQVASPKPKQYAVFTFGREFSGIQLGEAAVVEYYRRHLAQLARAGDAA
jgi:hypothetical protein